VGWRRRKKFDSWTGATTNSYKTNSWNPRAMIALGIAVIVMLGLIANGHAEPPESCLAAAVCR
jgi:hypothetical protein